MKKNNINQKIKITFITIGLATVIVLMWAGSTRAATWTQKADMPTPRWAQSVAVVNDRIYAIGGIATETARLNGKPLAAVEEYDPATDTWIRKADLPAGMATAKSYPGSMGAPVMDGKIYLIGGGNPGLARVDIYDPTSDTWSRGADMPTPRQNVSSVAFNGKIYAFGGIHSFSQVWGLNSNEVYDPKTDTWTKAAPIPRGVWGHSANVVDGKIYLIGGASSGNAERIHQVYDPQTDTWTNAAPMPIAVRHFGACVLRGRIYVVGGWLNGAQTPYSDTWVYDPILDTWTASTPLPEPKMAPLCTVNGRIYAIGGSPTGHNIQATATVWEFDTGFNIPPDFNGDGIVDSADVQIMVDYWHSDNALYDIAPAPWGDGIVDVQDLVLLSEHLFEEVLDSTLIAHWALDEIEGTIALDNVSGNDDFVMGNALWQPTEGKVNGALELDGIDDCVIASADLKSIEEAFSVIAWIKGGKPSQVMISQSGGVNWLMIDSEGNLMTELKGSGRSAAPLLSQTFIADEQWHRIGFVWDGSKRMLYVDSVPVAQDIQDTIGFFGSGLYIGVGKDYTAGTFFSGQIDDVRIYNRVVSP